MPTNKKQLYAFIKKNDQSIYKHIILFHNLNFEYVKLMNRQNEHFVLQHIIGVKVNI